MNTSPLPTTHPKTAERAMTRDVPTARQGEQIRDVLARITDPKNLFESVNYIYVLDHDNILVGVFSIKELLRADKGTVIDTLAQKVTAQAHPKTHRERIAQLAIKYNLKAIPVVDKHNVFLGSITADTIFDILHTEHIEDVLHMAGVVDAPQSARVFGKETSFFAFRKRLPWLIVGLVGGILASFVVGYFEDMISQMLILAAFIPAVVYMADAVGSQAQMIFIRALATEHNLRIKTYARKEFVTGLMLSCVLGVLVLIYGLLASDMTLGIILGVSLFITTLLALGIAILFPYVLAKMGSDPAIASGPFATVVRDILSIVVYFGVASLVLAHLL